jgi:hypothetical protein
MKHAYWIKNANLSYVNLITQILRLYLRDIPQRYRIHPTNFFHELSNLGWVNNSIGEPPVWTPNHKHLINSWIKDPNAKVNQYIDPNSEEPILEPEPTQEVGTSSQPHSYATNQVLPLNRTVTLNIFFDLSICKTILNFIICLV